MLVHVVHTVLENLRYSQEQKIEIFSHRYLIEFYETNRTSHVPHLYDIVNLLK